MANGDEMLGGGQSSGGGLKAWARWKEFEKVKRIVPVSLKNIEGNEQSDPKFLDDDGKFRRLTFQDMDNGGMERKYDDPFPNFKEAVGVAMTAGIFVKGVACLVHWEKDDNGYTVWKFEKDAS